MRLDTLYCRGAEHHCYELSEDRGESRAGEGEESRKEEERFGEQSENTGERGDLVSAILHLRVMQDDAYLLQSFSLGGELGGDYLQDT